ncbi:MAG: hypothetical protein CVT63_03210 [Candidatus Anoxymicrobium japonicum]|uniref:Zinc metalloprotease n=1 Tax=Candidatus Anoxymicrobium japonicum TaxID=2013648 RepID=A0A2N3G6M1_9ACTN|nr:MAG: hypothetical protein CVT63_03210 [Candidatus Anoxymicrobium japonicum]
MFPGRKIRIARIFGIEIEINPTWLIIFLLVGYSLGETMRDASESTHPGRFPAGPWPWIFGFGTALIFFACLLAHELSHSYIARRNGVNIRRITLFLFGGVAEMSEDVSDPGIEFRMAVVGPLMTFFLTGVFYLIFRIIEANPNSSQTWLVPLYLLVYINLFVGVFNLLPGFPLDGGRIFRAILWKITGDVKMATRVASYCGEGIAVLMGALGAYLLFRDSLLSGVWLMLVAAFIFQLSRVSYRQTLFKLAIADKLVGDLALEEPPIIDDSATLAILANYFSVYNLPALPIVDGTGKILGFVSRDDLESVNPSERDLLSARRLISPLKEEHVIGFDMPLEQAIHRASRADQIFVIINGERVLGILSGDDLMRYAFDMART